MPRFELPSAISVSTSSSARREALQISTRMCGGDELGDDLGVDDGPARHDGSHRGHKHPGIGDAVLQQIAGPRAG